MEIGHISYHLLDHIANLRYILSIVISLDKESSKEILHERFAYTFKKEKDSM